MQIEASRLEVRDKEKMATFTGNVKVVQGDTTMRCKTLVVFYEQQNKDGQQAQAAAGKTMPAAKPGPGGSSQISKLEASGGVTVVQKDQTATGDRALFDMKSNTVTLLGNVLVSQGPNVMRGEKLVVDLTTGVSRVDAGKRPGSHADSAGAAAGQGGRRLAAAAQNRCTAPVVVEIDELSGHRRRAVESLPPSDYHAQMSAEPGAGQPTCLTNCSRCFGAAAVRAGEGRQQWRTADGGSIWQRWAG